MSSALRQGITDRGNFWGMGLEIPIGFLFAQSSAVLTWGTGSGGVQSVVNLRLSDCDPNTIDAYEPSAPDPKKYETRYRITKRWADSQDAHDVEYRYFPPLLWGGSSNREDGRIRGDGPTGGDPS